MAAIEIIQASALDKIFPYQENFNQIKEMSALRGEKVSWQIAIRADEIIQLSYSIDSELAPYIQIRRVGFVPVELAAYEHDHDDDFISLDAGIYPDILYPLEKDIVIAKPKQYTTLWITASIPENIKADSYTIVFAFKNPDKSIFEKCRFTLQIIDSSLPEQTLKYSQWLHADCIADYYNLEVFSDNFWSMADKFISLAVETGINMIFTPLFTPPLDLKFGNERTNIQLITVIKNSDGYSFEFDNLKKWMDLCRSKGIHIFEFSHLFSQWGAKYTPIIWANTENGYEKIFGWAISSKSAEYEKFLRMLFKELTAFLKNQEGEFYFHVSDEPDNENIENYLHGYNILKECVNGFKIIDAISKLELYQHNISEFPIPNITVAEEFYNAGVKERWLYYSCENNKEVPNRYIAMPSRRSRIIGLLFYKFKVDGFLHWGFNFYNSGLSDFKINPFAVTDSFGLMPAGDAFSVYPASAGPIESIRSAVFHDALSDLAACQRLESLAGRDAVLGIIEKYGKLTFTSYPRSDAQLLDIRESLNHAIARKVKDLKAK